MSTAEPVVDASADAGTTGRPTFDACGPLPVGTTVLEASAGTGKTFTIAALTARYVAEGHAELSELMLVTFGRMASNELRSRVRERLVTVEAALASSPGSGVRGPSGPVDEVVALLVDVDDEERVRRRERVRRALADFDAATIATTHEFCLQMLDGLGVLGDREPDPTFVEQVVDLTDEVASDLYLQRYAATAAAPMKVAVAQQVARDAVDHADCRLVPTPDGDDPRARADAAGERVAYAQAVRTEVERRKRAGRLLTFDDMLTRLRDALADPEHGEAAARRLRERYRVVMVDEFQDTDPVQWEILQRAFGGHTTMVLIGDPKQAIYGFRGADVLSYLDATHGGPDAVVNVASLDTNWRSDADLLAGLDALMGGAALGHDEIVVHPVRAHHTGRRLHGRDAAGPTSPVRLRVVPHDPDAEKVPRVGTLRPRILADLVADVTRLLASGSTLDLDGPDRPGGSGGAGGAGGSGPRPVAAADVAVLVRTNVRGEQVCDALVAAGVPAVMHAARSVFASETAQEWLTLLIALEQPRQAQVRLAALTCFFGWTVDDLARADEDALIGLSQRVRGWRKVLGARGVAALVETITVDTRVGERLLSVRGGSRRLTDLRHLAQSLHAVAVSRQLGVGALVEWLGERIADARLDSGSDGSRRLDTDASAVTVVTVHRSKGLEYPVVYLPDAWDRYVDEDDSGRTLRLHEDGADGRPVRVLDVGGKQGQGRPGRFRRHQAEEAGEDLRLLYVALTRARCQVVTWWAPSKNTTASALQRFLFRPPTGVPAAAYPLSAGDAFHARSLGPHVSLESVEPRTPTPWRPPGPTSTDLAARSFVRPLDLRWRRTSYSGLTAAVHGVDLTPPGVGSEPEPSKEDDETGVTEAGAVTGSASEGSDWDAVSPMAELPRGTDFGTAVHAVFELVDPTAPDLRTAVRDACALTLARGGGETMTAEALTDGLLPAFVTPLGPLADDRRLADLARADTLAELGFELPLAGGDHARTGDLTLGALVPLLRRHLPPDDPLAAYADLVAHPMLADQSLRGYLTGSIDAVLRVRDPEGEPRYLVVDYKTNWLGAFDGSPLTLGPYAPPRLADAMMAAHYPLQALLYGVAVHRMLRWRQPGYDPDRHLGGVLYLFVRGMAGPQTPRVDGVPAGVFSWRPPTALVTELSDLLDGSGLIDESGLIDGADTRSGRTP